MLINRAAVIYRLLPHVGPEHLFQLDKLSNDELTQIPWWIGAGAKLDTAMELMRSGKSFCDYADLRKKGDSLSVEMYRDRVGDAG